MRRILHLRALLSLFLLFAAPVCAQLPLRPSGLTTDAAGDLFYADTARHQVLESTAAGTLKVIAGTGDQGFSGDGSAATAALLNTPQAVALAPDGTLYIADTGNNRVRAVSPAGVISTVASSLHLPSALALDAAGNLLIADTASHRILRLTGATLSTVAGTGTQGFSGDGGPATAATLDSPAGVAVLPDGRIVLADTHNQRLRVIALDGTISTLAGTGVRGFSGDGGPASAAMLALPRGLATLSDGTILLADSDNHRVRSVSSTGIITTLAGSSTQGGSPDAVAAASATLDTPRALAVNPYGAPIFADHLLRALISQTLYNAASESPRVSTLTLNPSSTSVSVTAQGTAGTPQGTVTLFDGAAAIATVSLVNGNAAIPVALSSGTHTLTANYSGDAFNPAATTMTTLSTSALPTVTTMAAPGSTYAGLPLSLSASVAPAAATGTVTFMESGAAIASARLSNGTGNAVYSAPSSGQHSLTAVYSGDSLYAPSTSASATTAVLPMPDFTLTVANPVQTANNGATLTFTVDVNASSGPFTGAVSFSAAGLPSTTTVTFAPPQVIPGAGTATTTMSIPTDKLLASAPTMSPLFYALLLLPMIAVARYRRLAALSLVLVFASGCGTRIAPNSSATAQPRSYTVTVTGAAANLAGVLVTHSAQVTLTVQ